MSRGTGNLHAELVAPLWSRLASRSQAGQTRMLLDLVRSVCDKVVKGSDSKGFSPTIPWRLLGIRGAKADELRRLLHEVVAIPLPATVFFDHPNPLALAAHLREQILGERGETPTPQETGGSTAEPIVILGMSCRYPGGVSSPEDLWKLVIFEKCPISDLPKDRGWDLDRLSHPDPALMGTTSAHRGGFLDCAADFDPEFFGISPREAVAMNPQQRLLLETSWEALERSGLVPTSLSDVQVGVFIGSMSPEYGPRMHEASPGVKGSVLTGTTPSVSSGRLSYFFGFEGPALTVDTACSASLVGIHLACQSLRAGECGLALAGGVTFTATPGMFTEFSKQGGLAPDGLCKSFAADADGTVWSEGVGILVLARLSDAQRLGYPILAVIRGSAINQDGASNGLTAPNGVSQQRLIRQALANAGLSPAEVDVVEAHGTGTRLGDPIEATAIITTYGQDRPAEQPLWLGSLKSNIGHSQAAAGVGGVIKMVMAMHHGVLPKTLHVTEPSRHVDWSAGAVRLLTEQTIWPETGRPRRAAVSSFGISGTNAHLILEQAPANPDAAFADDLVPWIVSGKSEQALRVQADRLRGHMLEHPDLNPGDVGWSLATSRSQFSHRAVVLARQRAQFLEGMAAITNGMTAPNVVKGTGRSIDKIVFVFPGQGSQWAGMGRQLLAEFPTFAERLAECSDALARYCDWSLLDVLRNEPGSPGLERVDVVQPALFAVMVSLAELWISHGVQPDAVIGHSQGEIAAACVSGALSLPDAAKVVALRSQALARLTGRGGMLSVALSPVEAEHRIRRGRGRLEIAAINSPKSVVIAGDGGAVDEAFAEFEADGLRPRRIPVNYASHSRHVESIRDEIVDLLAGITPGKAIIPFFSTVADEFLDCTNLDAQYWYRNLRHTVRFADTVRAVLADQNPTAFAEISPHPVLAGPLEEIADEASTEVVVLNTIRRGHGDRARFTRSLAEAHVQGIEVNWQPAFDGLHTRRVDLPTYAFQRQRYWLDESREPANVTAAGLAATGHPLLPAVMELPGTGGLAFTGRLSPATHPWLADHVVAGSVLLPGAAFVEMALQAGKRVGCASVVELVQETPLVLPDRAGVVLRLTVDAPDDSGQRPFAVYAQQEGTPDARWTRHGSGVLTNIGTQPGFDMAEWPPARAHEVDVTDLYRRLSASGVDYGPAFQALHTVYRCADEVFAEVSLPRESTGAQQRFELHPILLDAALHVLRLTPLVADTDLMPFLWTGIHLHTVAAGKLRVRVAADGNGGVCLEAADDTGKPVATVKSLTLRPLPRLALFDAAFERSEAVVGPARVDTASLPDNSGVSAPPPSSLTNPVARPEPTRVRPLHGEDVPLRQQLGALAEGERLAALLDLVRAGAATVLGHGSGNQVPPDRLFKELGVTSLIGVELRNLLSAKIGLRLTATAVFDYPTPAKLAAHINDRIMGGTGVQRHEDHRSTRREQELGQGITAADIDTMSAETLIAFVMGEGHER